MLRLGLIAASLSFAAAQSVLLWQQHEDAAVYTSAGLSLHSGRSPTFSTATWLNQPVFVEVSNNRYGTMKRSNIPSKKKKMMEDNKDIHH